MPTIRSAVTCQHYMCCFQTAYCNCSLKQQGGFPECAPVLRIYYQKHAADKEFLGNMACFIRTNSVELHKQQLEVIRNH